MLAFDQHRIAKLVGAVTVLDKGCGGALQHRIVSEGAKELEMAFAGLVHPGENCIHDAQPSFTSDASARKAIPRTYAAVGLRGGFQRSDNGRPDGDDAPTRHDRLPDRRCRPLGNAIGLVERESLVENGIPGRGNSGNMRERRKTYAALPPGC